MVSLSTLCRERPGIHAHDYSALMQVIRKHSALPVEDVAALFRHMVFNAAIGNVDDHLKNFWMLGRPSGYRLAPAFDLVPDITGRGEHTLQFLHPAHCPENVDLMTVASQWGVQRAGEIVGEVVAAVSGFAAVAKELAVKGNDRTRRIVADVERRLRAIGPH